MTKEGTVGEMTVVALEVVEEVHYEVNLAVPRSLREEAGEDGGELWELLKEMGDGDWDAWLGGLCADATLGCIDRSLLRDPGFRSPHTFDGVWEREVVDGREVPPKTKSAPLPDFWHDDEDGR